MKNKKDTKAKLSVVKNTYKDVDDYFETFEPLLFEEVKAQILQNQDPEEEGRFSSFLLLPTINFVHVKLCIKVGC